MKIAVLLVISCFIAAAYSESLKAPQIEDDDADLALMDTEVEPSYGEMMENEDENAEVEGRRRWFYADYCRCYYRRQRCRFPDNQVICRAPHRRRACRCRRTR
ncbi:PREDICTED: uncharacterized protein LOC109583335 [Amphimedon queenslandica]|uniref:Uncharacterized protein n=1 Tax=Amphimedon queenslandica TaxID=400682 RepID=A0A1X7UHJ2_AMPQE|nr:PREDICTED: uncharacterized protein LOC109583335 [Amphimedon queenslandica]|eukprot:XP_019854189.1 PREDICTED: uncharacterized protein LOC109583335 [Amphimedon queenslandica]